MRTREGSKIGMLPLRDYLEANRMFRTVILGCIAFLALVASTEPTPDRAIAKDQTVKPPSSIPQDVHERINEAIDRGDGVTATRLVRPFAEEGNPEAQRVLGAMFLYGFGVQKDPAEAEKWLKLSADNGNLGAQWMLGSAYRDVTFGEKDEFAAYKYLRAAAEQGFAQAQFELGVLIDPGEFEGGPAVTILGSGTVSSSSIPKNAVEAARWYRAAAEQGMPEALYNLGVCYSQGRGVPVNKAEAVRYYRMSAKLGDKLAQNNLARAYAEGEGVPRDTIRAYVWSSIAAAQGSAAAQGNMEILSERLSVPQRNRAEQIATRCFETRYQDCD